MLEKIKGLNDDQIKELYNKFEEYDDEKIYFNGDEFFSKFFDYSIYYAIETVNTSKKYNYTDNYVKFDEDGESLISSNDIKNLINDWSFLEKIDQ